MINFCHFEFSFACLFAFLVPFPDLNKEKLIVQLLSPSTSLFFVVSCLQ